MQLVTLRRLPALGALGWVTPGQRFVGMPGRRVGRRCRLEVTARFVPRSDRPERRGDPEPFTLGPPGLAILVGVGVARRRLLGLCRFVAPVSPGPSFSTCLSQIHPPGEVCDRPALCGQCQSDGGYFRPSSQGSQEALDRAIWAARDGNTIFFGCGQSVLTKYIDLIGYYC